MGEVVGLTRGGANYADLLTVGKLFYPVNLDWALAWDLPVDIGRSTDRSS